MSAKYSRRVLRPCDRLASALVLAAASLLPAGAATADALDKVVADDTKSGNKDLAATDNTLAQVAWRLRNRNK